MSAKGQHASKGKITVNYVLGRNPERIRVHCLRKSKGKVKLGGIH